jgi:predicted negative regulator of RcsB-dependent stress response
MPRAIKKRAKKKAAPDVDVQDRLSEIKDIFAEKQRHIVMYGGSALIVLFVVVGIFFYRSAAAQKAREIEYEAYKTYYNEYQQYPSPQAQYQKALELFQQAYSKRKSPRTLLYIAGSYERLGRYDDAVKSLNDFLQTFAAEKDLIALAYEKIANIELRTGKKAEALKTLETLYASSATVYKDFALVQTARILESEGKTEEARAKYRELLDKFKDSPFVTEAQARVGEKKEG